jgi:FtsH-binding integral membrane protein
MVSPIATNITEIFRNPRVLSGAAIVSGLVGLLALFFINNVYVQVYPLMLLFAGLLSMYTLSSRKEKLSLDFRLGTLIYLAFLLSMCLTVLMYVRSDFSRGLLVYISIIIMYVTGLLSALRIQNL